MKTVLLIPKASVFRLMLTNFDIASKGLKTNMYNDYTLLAPEEFNNRFYAEQFAEAKFNAVRKFFKSVLFSLPG